ncbi:hypothetical protein ABL78_3460 [Leptomonas seymouri]|uniref:Major facilitator superfamily (MFS) profile domain-containing protein n=1 Tax=Leptomonas seymouri TaxID=5684 RepID=A0A0N1ILB5_LEPSE|nr:hypothetical protein ABL78_3460 [Leptomonas seymouri]|eukprot:KPI87471.1 hypothetical protein ABL78_3460 [Leptomonas seymouri]
MLSSYSPNVASTLWYTFMDGACYSLWGMQLLPLYLKEITSRATTIGLAATASGLAQLVGALGAGYVADRQSRQLCIRAGALCAAAALFTLLLGICQASATVILVGQTLWGLYTGITSTSVEALFADSVPQGRRTTIYNTKWMLQTLCYVVGYAAAAVLFALWHNTWAPEKMRVVLMAGVAVHPIAVAPLCWLSDRHAVQETEPEGHDSAGEDISAATAATASAMFAGQSVESDPLRKSSSTGVAQRTAVGAGGAASSSEDGVGRAGAPRLSSRRGSGEPQQHERPFLEQRNLGDGGATGCMRWGTARLCTRPSHLTAVTTVPYWMCAVDLLLAVGSGMSLPFFSLFFTSDRGVSPAGLYGIFITSTLLTAATSSALPWLIMSCKAGRIPTVIGVRLVGTAALFLLATAPRKSVLGLLPITVALFLCRNALMNSVFGVTRSVLMDCVARSNRAKWSAFESITSLSWAGSAAIGGWIVEAHGYQLNFTITALVQLVATMLMIPAALGARELDAPLLITVVVPGETVGEESDRT